MEALFVNGYNMVQECITLIMVPFKFKVTSSISVPLLHFSKVVWDFRCNFCIQWCDKHYNPFPNDHSHVVHCPMPVHFQQWPKSWTFSSGMIIHSIDPDERFPPTTQQLSTVMHLCHMIPAYHTSSHLCFDPGMLFQICKHTLWCCVMR